MSLERAIVRAWLPVSVVGILAGAAAYLIGAHDAAHVAWVFMAASVSS